MARVLAVVPDLMFGSRVQAALTAAGHEVTLVASVDAASAAGTADVVVADLASGDLDPGAVLAAVSAEGRGDADGAGDAVTAAGGAAGSQRPPALACYAHVEPQARDAALVAGFDLVVPRSRLNREGPELVARLLAG